MESTGLSETLWLPSLQNRAEQGLAAHSEIRVERRMVRLCSVHQSEVYRETRLYRWAGMVFVCAERQMRSSSSPVPG